MVDRALQDAELTVEQVDWLVLHQANQRILDSAAERLNFPPGKVVSNLARYGNTSAGSIPLALDEAVRSGSISPGSTVSTWSVRQLGAALSLITRGMCPW